jgi:hypothetical protein
MKIKPEDVLKRLESYMVMKPKDAALINEFRVQVLKILDDALYDAWEEGYDSGEQNDRFEP